MRAFAGVAALGVILGLSLSCGSSTQTVTSPSASPSKCQVTATAEPATFAGPGGAGTLTVATNRDCVWTAAASGSWILIGPPASGQGDGKVAFSVAANSEPSQRRGAINVGDQQVSISQDAACIFTVSPPNDSVSPEGERRTIAVNANGPQCPWTARSDTDWLTIVQGSQGTGSGEVVYEARPTSGPSRNGELTIAGQRVIVTQGVGCRISLATTSQTVSASGGSGSIGVTTAAGCPWSAQSETGWIAITSAASGTGPATVTFNVAASDGPARTGTVHVGPQVFTVTQNSGCRFGISPDSTSVTNAGGSGAIAVTTAAGCGWNASSNVPWITISAGGSGSGSGSVQFSVAATTGPARSGTLTVAGNTFTVTQSSGCTYSISPAAVTAASSGGPVSVTVNTGAGCPWTSGASVPWVHITSGQGAGPGTVSFTVDATPTSLPRSTALVIAGQTFTLNQDGAPCAVVVSPPAAAVGSGGGSGTFEVNVPEGCPWTAASTDAWLHVTGGASGSGDGTVGFSADANFGPLRTGTIVVDGRTFTVSQAAAGTLK